MAEADQEGQPEAESKDWPRPRAPPARTIPNQAEGHAGFSPTAVHAAPSPDRTGTGLFLGLRRGRSSGPGHPSRPLWLPLPLVLSEATRVRQVAGRRYTGSCLQKVTSSFTFDELFPIWDLLLDHEGLPSLSEASLCPCAPAHTLRNAWAQGRLSQMLDFILASYQGHGPWPSPRRPGHETIVKGGPLSPQASRGLLVSGAPLASIPPPEGTPKLRIGQDTLGKTWGCRNPSLVLGPLPSPCPHFGRLPVCVFSQGG